MNCEFRLGKAEKERDEARRFGEDAAKRYNDLLTEGRVLRCAFCSATYPPDTPPTQHEALTAHVLVCPTHPMRNVEADLATARAQVREELEGLALKMCQTCAGGHQGWDKIATRAPRDWHYGYAGQWSHHQHGEIDEWYRIACAAAAIHDRLRVLLGGQP